MAPLDPLNPTPAVSLNRVHLVDLPGIALDADARARSGYELISSAALTREIRARIGDLRLDPALDDHALRLAFDACLSSDDLPVRAAAEAVARRLGRNLGYLLLTLRRGDAANRAARPEWDGSYWAHWAQIRRVWLGGGLVSGRLGPPLRDHARTVIAGAGITDLALDLSPYGAATPQVGLARSAPVGTSAALVCDFGGTRVKCARATYRDNALVELRALPMHPASPPEGVFEHMLAVIRASWAAAGDLPPGSPVLLSIAAYVRDGQPLLAQRGLYMYLRDISDNAQQAFADRLRAASGQPVPVLLQGDGQSAGMAHAGTPHSAVIMIGTALGIGFPPPSEAGLRPVASEFALR